MNLLQYYLFSGNILDENAFIKSEKEQNVNEDKDKYKKKTK